MAVVAALRGDNAYFALGKQSTPGTAVAPTNFPRWLDGSEITIDLKAEDIWEGDTSRRLSQIIKNRQMVTAKLICDPRPVELALLEVAALGAASDTVTPPSTGTALTLSATTVAGNSSNTTTTAPVSAGAGVSVPVVSSTAIKVGEILVFDTLASGVQETVTVTATVDGTHFTATLANAHATGAPVVGSYVQISATTGLTASGTSQIVLSPGTANEEVLPITTPAFLTAGGNWFQIPASYNAGAGLRFPHTIGDAVRTSTLHTIVDTTDGNFYSVEVSLGGTAGIIIRMRDCKVKSIKRSSKAGMALTYEVEFVGIACLVQTSAATVTLENRQLFLFTQGAWTLDGVTTGDAPNVESFDISQKNNVDEAIQTEQVILAGLIFGNIEMNLGFAIVFINSQRTALTYFGSTTGTTDTQAIGTGSLVLLFTQADSFHTVQFTLPFIVYTKAELPKPKKDGKHFSQTVSATSTTNMGVQTSLLSVAAANVQTTAF